MDIELTLVLRLHCFLDDLPAIIGEIEETSDAIVIDYDWIIT